MIGETISHYRIVDKLGEGGMGVVYKAEDTKLRRTVALKFFPPHAIENRERFLREAQAAAALDHPNVCTIYEFGESDGRVFLSMAYVDGQPLSDRIRERPLKLQDALDVAIQAAEGLRAAHAKGVIHRDIKSSNLMVTRQGQVKIMDFGLAQLAGGTRLTQADSMLGTAAYMSPEQAQRMETDRRTDIWSLGVVLYEMVTGRLPFEGEREQAVVYSIIHSPHEPVTAVRAGLPIELDRILSKAMAKERVERIQNVEDMLVDLRALLKSLSTDPGVAGAAHRFRTRAWIAGAGIIAASLALSLGLNLGGARDRVFGGPSTPVRTASGINSIAVLPFANMTSDPENEYLADGLAQEVIDLLAKHSDLLVVSRTSAFAFKGKQRDVREIARELNVNSVVEGSLRQSGNRIRVSVQLTDARNGFQIWSETFDRDSSDILAVEQEISKAIVAKLAPTSTISPDFPQPTKDARAYDLYLRGKDAMATRTKDGLIKAERHFQEALSRDPEFGSAWAALAETVIPLHEIHSVRDEEQAYAIGSGAARRALTGRVPVAEGHAALAHILWHQGRWAAAEKEARLAIAKNPGSPAGHTWLAWVLQALGRFAETERVYRRAIELDPFGTNHYGLAICLIASGRPAEAIPLVERSMQIGFQLATAPGVLANVQLQRIEAAQKVLDNAPAGTPTHLVDGLRAYLLASRGEKDQARQLLSVLVGRMPAGSEPSPLVVPFAYAALGEPDRALEWVSRSRQGSEFLAEFRYIPEIRALAGKPKMRELIQRFGLPDF